LTPERTFIKWLFFRTPQTEAGDDEGGGVVAEVEAVESRVSNFGPQLGQERPKKTPDRCQFHQYIMSSFFIPKFFVRLLCAYNLGLLFFWQKDFDARAVHKILVKLTPGWKGMSGTNTLAYFASSPVTKKKSLMPLTVVALSRRSRTDSLIIYTPPSVAEAAGATFYIKRSGEIDYVVLLKVSWPV